MKQGNCSRKTFLKKRSFQKALEIPKGGSRVSKRVIIVPVTLGHFPPELQAEGAACFRISVKEGGDSGVLVAAKPQAGHSEGGRKEALVLSILSSEATCNGGRD